MGFSFTKMKMRFMEGGKGFIDGGQGGKIFEIEGETEEIKKRYFNSVTYFSSVLKASCYQ